MSEEDLELLGCHYAVWLRDEAEFPLASEPSSGTQDLPTTSNAALQVTNCLASAIPHTEDDGIGEVDEHGDLHHNGLVVKSFTSYNEEDQAHLTFIMDDIRDLQISQERLDERLPDLLWSLRWTEEALET